MRSARSRCAALLTVGLLTVTLLATACSSANSSAGNGLPTAAPPSNDGSIHVVAAESLWGDIAKQIGGGRVTVTSILSDPNQDPHEYQSGVGDAATINAADLVIVNGADYDPFMNRLLSVDKKSGRSVLTVAAIVHAKNGANPHFWYNPDYVLTTAAAIEKALAGRDPAHAAQFAAGLTRFQSGEQHVVAVIDQIKAGYAGQKVGYTEPVPAYLVQAAGLQLGTPVNFTLALQNGTDPTPGDSAHFEQAITTHTIRALLLNTQVGDAQTARLAGLARSSHIPVVDVTETLPPGMNFQTWQAAQATDLLAALHG
jgi:zinc/manganese transport system substrate-binding protein